MFRFGKRHIKNRMPEHLSFVNLLVAALLLTACVAKEKTSTEIKVGLHFDAVLEFVIEYPLTWQKDRRVKFGSSSGEVRWTDPATPTTMIRVFSVLEQTAETADQQLVELLPEHQGISITLEEKMTLPAGEATHIRAATAKNAFEAYLLRINQRFYTIVLITQPDDLDGYQHMLSKVIESFINVK